MLPAVIYARVSSKEQQEEGFSIPAQLKLLREYATENDIEIAHEYTDVETAKATGRSAFGEMVEYLSNLPAGERVVLVEKTDRLYRNLRDYVTIDELEATIHFVREGTVMSPDSHSSERFMHGIKVLMARNYIENLGEEASKGMQQKAEQGTWPSAAPLGYQNVEIDGGRKVAPDPEAGSIVARMFELYATDDYSLDDIVEIASEEGLRGTRGGPLNKSTMENVLQNIFYTGRFVWKDREYQGDHEPLVSMETWLEAQKAFRKDNKPSNWTDRQFAYTGLMTCAHCGCAITAEKKKGKYIYYHCTGNNGECPQPYINEDDLEEHFCEIVEALAVGEETLDWIRGILLESHRDEKQYHQEQITRLQQRHTQLQNQIDTAYEHYIQGKITEVLWERRTEDWRKEQHETQAALERHRAANESYIEAGCTLLRAFSRMAQLWSVQSAPEKRKLLDIIQSNLTWDGTRVVATYVEPFCWMVENDDSQKWLTILDDLRNWMYSPAAEFLAERIA